MKAKIIQLKRSLSPLAFMLGVLLLYLLTSCNDKIDIIKNYDFEVKILPVPKTIKLHEPVEIRLEIRPIGGNYAGTRYSVRSFQYSGKGSLINEEGELFFPNDLYDITNHQFRLYFTAESGTSQEIELVFVDSWRHEHVINLSFSIDEN